jgi:hypothetical protein
MNNAPNTGPVNQDQSKSWPTFPDCGEAALFWHDFGFCVIPIRPRTKIPGVTWDAWAANLSAPKIREYWRERPDHEVGFIVGDAFIVFDADSPESVDTLIGAEARFGIAPRMVVATKRGEHHYYRREPGSHATSACYCTREQPERVDIKTGRSMVILPPSTGKTIVSLGATAIPAHVSELSVAPQAFIDALAPSPRRSSALVTPSRPPPDASCIAARLPLLQACLKRLDPDLAYPDWFRVAAAVFHETAGTEAGFDLFDGWSCAGRKYKGKHDTRQVWKAFRLDHPRPTTIATLIHMLGAEGHDWNSICDDATDPFVRVDGEGE